MESTDSYDPYEAEETLSLCDLPVYSDASNWDDYSKGDQSLSSDNDNDFFEFFSEDFSSSTCAATADKNIIFCGKLIACREPASPEKTHKNESNKTEENRDKRRFPRWKSLSFSKKRSSADGSKAREYDDNHSKLTEDKRSNASSLAAPKSNVHATANSDFSIGKVSVLTPPAKSRWYLLMFGVAKLPSEMELTNIRTRQSRLRSQSMMSRSVECDEMARGKERRRGKGLWSLLRVLGCSTQQKRDAVKASYGGVPCE